MLRLAAFVPSDTFQLCVKCEMFSHYQVGQVVEGYKRNVKDEEGGRQ